jgi:site-specific recombinase XerD
MLRAFQSPLADGIQRFLETKHALARKYRSEQRELHLFDDFLVEHGVTAVEQITSSLIDTFLTSRPRRRARSFNHLRGVLRLLFDWLVVQGELPNSPVRVAKRRETSHRVPFLFDSTQARRLLQSAAELPDRPKGPLRGPTYRTIFAIQYGLGLRVGEACNLTRGDVNLERDLLIVRGGKFGKSRLVPFGPRLHDLLREHLLRRAGQGATDDKAPLFTFNREHHVNPCTVSQTFHHLVQTIGFIVPDGVAHPRLHDLRHSFAVGTLLRWYREGVDPTARLHHLATFLGHVNPVSTAVYLTITVDLLHEANCRFEKFASSVCQGVTT